MGLAGSRIFPQPKDRLYRYRAGYPQLSTLSTGNCVQLLTDSCQNFINDSIEIRI